MKRIQIIGTQRSGSNLLRVMLNQHQNVCAPHPPHLLKTFYPLLPRYGNLQSSDNFAELVEDMITWVELNPVAWRGFSPSSSQIIDRCTSPTIFQAFKAIYDWEARLNGKNVWVCKSMTNYEFADDFEKEKIFDHYIFLYRDGRDVALSFSKAIVGPKSAYYCAAQWNYDQTASIKLQQRLGPKVFALSYEQLIQNPAGELERLFVAIGLEMPEDLFEFPSSAESRVTADAGEMWKNVVRPIIPDNKLKYVEEMSQTDQNIYESVAGAALHSLGYPVYYWPEHTLSFSEQDLERMAQKEAILKAEAKTRTPLHDLNLRRGQDEFLSHLLQRKAI
ncbi:MAG: sulfotransferase [Imperialibacter sp.]|uniref:sulfotransferase family protein n=1 Tax=Imperialibacter sp. TaxID=2038411 RepID=UPI0032EB8060